MTLPLGSNNDDIFYTSRSLLCTARLHYSSDYKDSPGDEGDVEEPG